MQTPSLARGRQVLRQEPHPEFLTKCLLMFAPDLNLLLLQLALDFRAILDEKRFKADSTPSSHVPPSSA